MDRRNEYWFDRLALVSDYRHCPEDRYYRIITLDIIPGRFFQFFGAKVTTYTYRGRGLFWTNQDGVKQGEDMSIALSNIEAKREAHRRIIRRALKRRRERGAKTKAS